jgi:mannan endo-1,4-beta-mannosidase
VWRRGDQFTGDPPQEPQGRNSVFATDESTLAILEDHAETMKAIQR